MLFFCLSKKRESCLRKPKTLVWWFIKATQCYFALSISQYFQLLDVSWRWSHRRRWGFHEQVPPGPWQRCSLNELSQHRASFHFNNAPREINYSCYLCAWRLKIQSYVFCFPCGCFLWWACKGINCSISELGYQPEEGDEALVAVYSIIYERLPLSPIEKQMPHQVPLNFISKDQLFRSLKGEILPIVTVAFISTKPNSNLV